MKEINLLTSWSYGINTPMFRTLLHDLKVNKCAFFYEGKEDYIEKEGYLPIYAFEGLNYYKNADIKYELDSDILSKIGEYEPVALDIVNRWRRSYCDKDDFKTIKEMFFVFLRYWNNYIIENEINLFIYNIIPHVPTEYIAYIVCKCKGIPTIIQGVIPLIAQKKTNYVLQPGVGVYDENLERRYKEYARLNTAVELPEYMEGYFSQYSKSNKIANKGVVVYNKKNTVIDNAKAYKERISIYLKRKDYKILKNKAGYLFKTRLEKKSFLNQVIRMEKKPDLERKYYFFALHSQPEASTLPSAGIFRDQLLAIRMISKFLPEDTLLYVKEHPSYWKRKGALESIHESRSFDFYEEICSLRNVRLISHDYSTSELLEKCKAVVTIRGSIAFEALFKGMPIIVFGGLFYECYPSVFRVHTNDECKQAIDYIESHEFQYDERKLRCLLKAVSKYVIPMGMNEKNYRDNGIPAVSDEDRQNMVNKIVEFYKEYYDDKTIAVGDVLEG